MFVFGLSLRYLLVAKFDPFSSVHLVLVFVFLYTDGTRLFFLFVKHLLIDFGTNVNSNCCAWR